MMKYFHFNVPTSGHDMLSVRNLIPQISSLSDF